MFSRLTHTMSLLSSSTLSTLALASTLILTGCSEQTPKEEVSYHHAAKVKVFKAQNNYQVSREYIGRVVAKQQTQLAFEYGGRVKNIHLDSGEYVAKDQVIAELDTEILAIRAREIKAQIKQAQAQQTLNKANLTRVNKLIEEGYASKQNVDELMTEQGVLIAQIDGLNASLASLDYQIEKAQLKAPYAGIISERVIAQGDMVASGKTAFKLIKQSTQEITLGVPFNVAEKLNLEQNLPINIGGVSLSANIIAIGQQINPLNHTIELRLALSQENERFNGQIARATIIQTIEEPGYWIPISALTDGMRGQWNIFQAISEPEFEIFKIQAVTVNVLHTTATHAYVSRTADKSIALVTEGLHRYVPGQLIRSALEKNTEGAQ